MVIDLRSIQILNDFPHSVNNEYFGNCQRLPFIIVHRMGKCRKSNEYAYDTISN